MRNIKSILLRFNIDDPEHKKAYEFLQKRDRCKYHSNTEYMIKAILSLDGEQSQNLEYVVKQCLAECISGINISLKEIPTELDDDDVAWDFIGCDKPDIKM